MPSFAIKNIQLVTRDQVLAGQAVLVEKGKIRNILPEEKLSGYTSPGTEIIDGQGQYLVPGFVDVHIHGAMDHLADWGPDDIESMSQELLKFGVTGFLPTMTPQPDTDKEMANLKACAARSYGGAAVLGFFLEGHYLALTGSLTKIPRDYSKERVQFILDQLSPYPVIFGISPEVPGITELLPIMTQFGRPAFITHTKANVEQTQKAIAAGATHATHFYDVFPYPGDQEGGVRGCGTVEAILASDHTTVDFILDGEHVAPIAVQVALKAMGPDRVMFCTDANVNAGMPPGTYASMGGQDITVAYYGAPARLGPNSRSPGGLNGSGLTLDMAVRNALKLLGVSLPQAVAMASTTPARVLGYKGQKGLLQPGYDADMVLMDKDLYVAATWVGGKKLYWR